MNISPIDHNFSSFYETWLKQLEIHLQPLVLGHQPNYDSIVATLITHHKNFYTAKWAAAHQDILPFFSPKWASPLEFSFTWVTGWKPSTVFRLVDSLRKTRTPLTSLSQLSDDQVKKIKDLGVKIKLEEQRVERELERLQVSMGDLKMVELTRLVSRVNEDSDESTRINGLVDVAFKEKLDGLEKVMKMGDYVRLKTLKCVLDVFSSRQGVDFLAVFGMIQIQIRKWGKQRDAIFSNNLDVNTSSLNLAYQP
ncbi:unnamed protein product [Amaranthus hypochondriacus]